MWRRPGQPDFVQSAVNAIATTLVDQVQDRIETEIRRRGPLSPAWAALLAGYRQGTDQMQLLDTFRDRLNLSDLKSWPGATY
jgi:hypothetical protein